MREKIKSMLISFLIFTGMFFLVTFMLYCLCPERVTRVTLALVVVLCGLVTWRLEGGSHGP